MRVLVFEYRTVTLEYFLFKMTPIELDMCTKNLEYTDRPLWDTTRILSMFTIMPHTRKRVKLHEMFPLPWDQKYDPEEQDLMRHAKQMEAIAEMLTKRDFGEKNKES